MQLFEQLGAVQLRDEGVGDAATNEGIKKSSCCCRSSRWYICYWWLRRQTVPVVGREVRPVNLEVGQCKEYEYGEVHVVSRCE